MDKFHGTLVFLTLSCCTFAIPYNYDWNTSYMYSDSSERECLINDTTLKIMFSNLRKLMYR